MTPPHWVHAVREIGTWELSGHASGNTLVNMRYRGFGGIVCSLEPIDPADPARGVKNAFSTTEIMLHAVGKAPVVSPAVPGKADLPDRAAGFNARHAAWICQMQRGAGHNWIDFQFRPNAALVAYFTRMEAIRSLTEIYPGDTAVSQTDCLYFPRSTSITSTTKRFLALVNPQPWPDHEWHTRWQELDQHARDLISADLGFQQAQPLPSLGVNWDSGWSNNIPSLTGRVEALAANGVRKIMVHHPGWFNGRGLRQRETPHPIPTLPDGSNDTGGDCSIHDYVAQSPDVATKWAGLHAALKKHNIQYWVWVTGMLYRSGPVVQRVGTEHFSRNRPGATHSDGYPPGHFGISILHPPMLDWWKKTFADAQRDLGFEGFWADSFQNMFMSQMNYQREDWAPQVRQWWDVLAEQSRQGIAFMSESQGFPGISCSVEVSGSPHDFENIEWTLPYVIRWYRGEKVPHAGTPTADRLFFRSMANRGPIAPGGGDPSQVPSYARFSAQYMAALPHMHRPYQLPDRRGVLYLPESASDKAVLFSFANQPLPENVKASTIVGDEPAKTLDQHTTYRISGPDLLKAFGILTPPHKDPRLAP